MRLILVAGVLLLSIGARLVAAPVELLDPRGGARALEASAHVDDEAPLAPATAIETGDDEAAWRALADRERVEIVKEAYRARPPSWMHAAADEHAAAQRLREEAMRAERHLAQLERLGEAGPAPLSALSDEPGLAAGRASGAFEPSLDVAIVGIAVAMFAVGLVALSRRRRPRRAKRRRRHRSTLAERARSAEEQAPAAPPEAPRRRRHARSSRSIRS